MRVTLFPGGHFAAARILTKLAGAVSLLLILASTGASAQERVNLVHGLYSAGNTWLQTAQRLEQEYNVLTSRPDLNSVSTFENQSPSLISQSAGLPPNTIAVGHSNGGLVSRLANQDGRPWNGVLTIGTLHTGAPLAYSVISGQVFEEASYIAGSVAAPFLHYSYFYPDDWAWRVLQGIGYFAYSIGAYLPTGIAGIGFAIANPVLPQMVPGSSFLNQLNSAANLNREAAALPDRVSISSTVPTSWGMVFQSFAPDNYYEYGVYQYLAGASFYLAGLYYQEFTDYNDPWWYQKQAGVHLWFAAGAAMFNLDHDWCYLIGAFNGSACVWNDGVVPTSRMPYPNGTRNFNITGPAHTQETRDGYGAIAQMLTQDFRVAPRTPPPGGNLPVSIIGPSDVQTSAQCMYEAQASGGTPPYSYNWSAGETGQYITHYFSGSETLTVTVTDQNGATGSSSKFVAASPEGPICPY